MSRTLIIIPKMYREGELKSILGIVPEDLDETSREFWNYVEEKLEPFIGKINKIYCKNSIDSIEKTLKSSREDRECLLIKKILKENCKLVVVEDSLLVAEAGGWLEMMATSNDQGAMEMYKESVEEMDAYVVKTVNQTLMEGEIGVLLIESTRKILFSEDLRVIKMCRFDPDDYLKRWQTKIRLKNDREQIKGS